MEGLIVLAVFGVVFAPIIISIIALVKVSSLRNELDALKRKLRNQSVEQIQPPQTRSISSAPLSVPEKSRPAVKPKPAAPAPRPAASAESPAEIRPVAAKPTAPKPGIEFLMGGRAAAFIGIAILVIGIALLVGYAIQHAWLGPGARVLFGLTAGLVLVGAGYGVSRMDEKYTIFSRVLTGGGSALFYFTVFSAFAFYQLIGAVTAGAGLFIAAAAVFGLAMFYASQAVAVLGVLGAFVTPILIGGDLDAGVFPLVYVALINVPVILLGLRRKWQWLYNLAFGFTVIHSLIWMDRLSAADFIPGLLFFTVLYLQFAALGLLKLRHEQAVHGRTADLVRLVLLSVFLLGMTYWLFSETGKSGCGIAFALFGLLQFGVAALSHNILTRFSGEATAFVSGGIFALAMALPVQFDGEWVSLGWGIQGAVLAGFALRVKSRTLQAGAFFLGLTGIFKVMVLDFESYAEPPHLFLNARFAVGLVSAGLLALQGKFAARLTDENEPDPWIDAAWLIGAISAVLFFFTDIFWTAGMDHPASWLLTSAVLLAAGTLLALYGPQRPSTLWLGTVLLLMVPLKMLLIDAFLAVENFALEPEPFLNRYIWLQLILLALVAGSIQPLLKKRHGPMLETLSALPWIMNLAPLASALGLLSLEISRVKTDWAAMGITILWALSALALILYGMKRRSAPHRYFGLILFGLASLKVLLIDSSELDGLQRIGAFIGTGLLLLILAFAYQKASAFFQSLEE
ncbi:DUF2339 domain-containing protein [Pontiella agarivorans]|uniref:DUF2339 domain-containing protein n=1 Tax=Pontiella agarivorans TaxID=3038953 RepID=A0ABU5MWC2_9BACT|nr:DUF2339 domain-containing protein [Pontiella agarivorans]MDZ8118505.1 DUF2339 domain-containing protein [Pontiella agarivorans]